MTEQRKKVFLVSRPFSFLFTEKSDNVRLTSAFVSFCTEDGIFASFGHKPERSFDLSLLVDAWSEEKEASDTIFGISKGQWDYGVCGIFEESLLPSVIHGEYEILPISEVKEGHAELFMYDEAGNLKKESGEIVGVHAESQTPIWFTLDEGEEPVTFGVSGAVVIQDEKIAAVVCGADEKESTHLYCSSAEQMMTMIDEAKEAWQNEKDQ